MAHFYGTLQGSRGEATRCGTKKSNMRTIAASWDGCIRTFVYHRESLKEDWVEVWMATWHGRGADKLLYRGPIGRFEGESL